MSICVFFARWPYLVIYFLLLIAVKSEMSISNVQSSEVGLVSDVNQILAGY